MFRVDRECLIGVSWMIRSERNHGKELICGNKNAEIRKIVMIFDVRISEVADI